ncbi:hypothetical protein TSUD_321810 [Trifolium subterraneum]|uniref:Uncharacterized protein n=1 Tax=Trifolium subterraneum TaxID=3900 RepID=A0A2Z6NIB2_TRISU|nr:hypothetical protein TSUD_321810 [Trifolium subterraneum]
MAVTPFGNTSATQWGIRPQIIARSSTIAKFASSRDKFFETKVFVYLDNSCLAMAYYRFG